MTWPNITTDLALSKLYRVFLVFFCQFEPVMQLLLFLFDLIENIVDGFIGKITLLGGCQAGFQKTFQLLQRGLLIGIGQCSGQHIILDGLAIQGSGRFLGVDAVWERFL